MTSRVYEICDRYVDDYAMLDPNTAADLGLHHDVDTLTDLSPQAHEQRRDLAAMALRDIAGAKITTDRDRVAVSLFRERLQVDLDRYELQDHLRDIRTLGSSMQNVRETFDLMALDTANDWAVCARRMRAVPTASAAANRRQRAPWSRRRRGGRARRVRFGTRSIPVRTQSRADSFRGSDRGART